MLEKRKEMQRLKAVAERLKMERRRIKSRGASMEGGQLNFTYAVEGQMDRQSVNDAE